MIEGVVFTALRGLVANGDGTYRCYPSAFPQKPGADGEMTLATVLPAIRYAVVSETPVVDVCGTDNGETDDTRVQVDYVAMTRGAAVALRQSGRQALENTDPPCVRDNGFVTFDDQTRTHRAVDDYIFSPSSEEEP